MLKLIVTGLALYFLYYQLIKKPSLKKGPDNHHKEDYSNNVPPSSSRSSDHDGEYIDYEEVE